MRIEHVPNRPDLIQLRGYWILSVDEFFSTYNADNMRRTDPISKKSIYRGTYSKKSSDPPPRDGVRPLAFFRVAIVQGSS